MAFDRTKPGASVDVKAALAGPSRRATETRMARPLSDELAAHLPRVYRFALRLTGDEHLAEDITQDTFVRAWRKRRKLREPDAARVWLFRITHNLWRDQLRRDQVAQRHLLAVGRPDGGGQPADAEAMASDQSSIIESAIQQLPDRQREVLHLVACERLSLGEVAEVLRISQSAAKASLSLGRKHIRQVLQDEEPVAQHDEQERRTIQSGLA